jgi:transposase-like protein
MAKPDPTDKSIDDLIAGKKPEEKNTGNSRNGKTSKTAIGETGEMEITVPRDRNAR